MDEIKDFIVVGAGPAGLQLGYYLKQSGHSYLILEAGETPGTFFRTFPRHRRLISNNKVYTGFDDTEINLRWDWNSLLSDSDSLLFKNYTKQYFPKADEMVRYLSDYASHLDLDVKCDTKVAGVARDDDGFRLTDQRGDVHRCKRLVVATGFTRPYVPPIPGIELADNYYDVSVNNEEFVNQKVLIIGKGNSAFETADNLIPTAAVIHIASPNSVKMAWKTHFVGHLRAVNNNVLDSYQLKSQNAVLDASVDEIRRRDDGKLVVSVSYAHAGGEREELVYDRVIACTGFRFDASIFEEECRPQLTIKDRFPEQTSEWESTNVKDLYFAGTLMQMRDFKKTTSGFIHGFRYNVRAFSRILARKYYGEEWPSLALDATAEALTDAVIKRVNRTSALWQQFGFLCDVIVVPEDGGPARYYEELPTDYVRMSDFSANKHYYTVTLEYGPEEAFEDPFSAKRIARDDVENSHRSNFLHPILRRFSAGELVSEHHIIEDLAAEWVEDVHVKPLLSYFDDGLRQPAAQVQAG